MAHIYIECNNEAHRKVLQLVDSLNGEDGMKTYLSCHNKKDFIESLAEIFSTQ